MEPFRVYADALNDLYTTLLKAHGQAAEAMRLADDAHYYVRITDRVDQDLEGMLNQVEDMHKTALSTAELAERLTSSKG